MKFSRKKLPKEAIQKLRRIPVEICAVNSPASSPIYVYLQANRKFVAVKGPLQTFSPEDLEKLKSFENFYVPEFVDLIAPFQKIGRSVAELLGVVQKQSIQTNQSTSSAVILPTPQFEKDDAVLRLIGPLWGAGVKIEPFFLCFLVNEVCPFFQPERIAGAVNSNIDLFELAWLRAGAAVFLALHIGYTDARTLTLFRDQVFEQAMSNAAPEGNSGELSLLTELVWKLIPDAGAREISIEQILSLLENPGAGARSARKLLSRLKRVEAEFVQVGAPVASLYGATGLLDE